MEECHITEEKLFSMLDREDESLPAHLAECELCRGRAKALGGIIDAIFFERNTSRKLPEKVGDFRIVGLLGEGASGVVYEAIQEDPRRSIALKVLKGGDALGGDNIRLFTREVRSLARMRHPGIAQIFQAGTTLDGHPWLAMELVDGQPLDEFVKSNKLQQREILNLFRQVCGAIHYAHGRGIIHRDLKPTNIFVSRSAEGEGGFQVKVLDFGLARIDDSELSVAKTKHGKVIGTLQYMSPQQAAGEIELIDVRADIYSLGVILYELLVGHRPYEVDVSSVLAAAKSIAESKFQAMQLARRDDDLEVIVGKALRKDPDLRYGSVAEFADDLRRFESGLPINARTPSMAYMFAKLIRRNKAISTAAFLLLGVSLVATVKTQIDAANIQRQSQQLQHVTKLVLETFGPEDSEDLNRDTKMLEILPAFSERLRGELSEFPKLQLTLVRSIGVLYYRLGEFAKAETELRKALWLSEHVKDPVEIGKSSNQLAMLIRETGSIDEAERLTRQALDSFAGSEEASLVSVIHCKNNLVRILINKGQLAAAEKEINDTIALQMKLGHTDKLRLAINFVNLGNLAMESKRYAEAVKHFKKSLDLRIQKLGPNSRSVATSLVLVGWAERDSGNYAEAERLCRQALEIDLALLGDTHPATARTKLSCAKAIIGNRQNTAAAFTEALELSTAAAKVYSERYGTDHDNYQDASRFIDLAKKQLSRVSKTPIISPPK